MHVSWRKTAVNHVEVHKLAKQAFHYVQRLSSQANDFIYFKLCNSSNIFPRSHENFSVALDDTAPSVSDLSVGVSVWDAKMLGNFIAKVAVLLLLLFLLAQPSKGTATSGDQYWTESASRN